MSKWRKYAREVIEEAIASLPATASKSELKKAIDRAYPFHMRENYPYKVWLDERRKKFYELGILEKQPDKLGRLTRKPGVKQDLVPPGQLSLFDF
ncbi:MAG: hypothetical protein F6K62_25415 [Sphaerospermopsis sp. SIO1G2]|nr:hypothetical protein [Sphaerospermopsis sp. SIO1G2]